MIMPFFFRLFTSTLKIQHALIRNFVLVMFYAHIIIFLFSFTGTKKRFSVVIWGHQALERGGKARTQITDLFIYVYIYF